MTIIPVIQSFLLDHGLPWLGTMPDWELGYLLPTDWIFSLQVAAVLGSFFASHYILARRALQPQVELFEALRELLPWAVILLLIPIASLSIFNLPMEMRGASMPAG